MAQCKLTPREFISNAFSPQIGAICSAIAESVCQKNNLSFIELLQPFCNLNTEGHFKDPQGTTVTVRNLRLSVQDIQAQPPEPATARKMLNDSVSSEPCERTTVVRIGNVNLDIPVAVPWFEAWRERFLAVQFPSDHEFVKHFLACMIVVSTADDNPLEKIREMAAQLHQIVPGKLPKWFNNNALRYYVLLHDAPQDDGAKAESVFADMKNLYDANNCFLLQMNSRPPGHADDNTQLPDPWSQFLIKPADFNTSSDHSSSPRTPADVGGVSAMPNQVTTEPDKSSHASTPIAPHNPSLISPDIADKISLASDLAEAASMHVELGQEAVPVTIHPLSPVGHDRSFTVDFSNITRSSLNERAPINANVWADSPNHPIAHHGARLSTQDLDRIRTLVNEFCLKSLLPYVEKQIGLLNDVISNKKGVSRSLLSATKRWFGTSKPGAPGTAPTNAVIYTAESPELQLRRLGDLCFMFGHYTLAYQAYHSAKRDFAADQAWLYYAGALEMAALSAFMQGEMTRKTIEYMDDAILTYSNSCKMPQFATRATLMSAECLKARSLHGDAAKQLIRMTSEDSDLRSALLLEQAAYCFVHPKMIRKYAFHAVLAGHRFSKAGQRKHSLRCYQQAYQVYRGKGWSSAEDHIHYTIGRQAASLKHVVDAVRAFEKLLNESSKQPGTQQAAFLREFLHTHNSLLQENSTERTELPILPLPIINGNEIKVLLGHLPQSTDDDDFAPASNVTFDDKDDDGEERRWTKLEEMVMSEAQGSVSMIFKPTVAIYSSTSNNTVKPNAILDEPINLSIELHNPLKISIPLSKVQLLWSFVNDDRPAIGNETPVTSSTNHESSDLDSRTLPVDTEILDFVMLKPASKQRIVLTCTPREIGELKILGISYEMSNPPASDQSSVNSTVSVMGKRCFEIKGPRSVKNPKEKTGANAYGVDSRLDINVVDRAPFMQVSLSKISHEVLCGEMQRVRVILKNIGKVSLKNIYVGSTDSKLLCLKTNGEKMSFPVVNISLTESTGGVLKPEQKHEFELWIRAPHEKGSHRMDLLFYYENVNSNSLPKYRLCRHTWNLAVSDSIGINAIARRSALRRDNLPTLTIALRVKNINHLHDPFMNEIILDRISVSSDSWSIVDYNGGPADNRRTIKPQETHCMLLKLVAKIPTIKNNVNSSNYTELRLTADENNCETIANFPCMDFVGNTRAKQPQVVNENYNDSHLKNPEANSLAVTMRLNAILIINWRAKVADSASTNRRAIGQHHVNLEMFDESYNQPDEPMINRQNDADSTRLKIFGPDRNVPDFTTVVETDRIPRSEYQKNLLTFTFLHPTEIEHNFENFRLCVVSVTLNLQNHSLSRVDVRINTIGSSSPSSLPSIKSQVYSPQASTFFRYASHTSVNCQVEPLGLRSIKLNAVIPSPGTYNLASRVDVSAKTHNVDEYVTQKWQIESVCSVNDVSQ